VETIAHFRGFSAALSAILIPRTDSKIQPSRENAAALIGIAKPRVSKIVSIDCQQARDGSPKGPNRRHLRDFRV
jgi:hypothetical protein